jgi:mannose-1-phosphate guanylyltransferase
VQGLHLGIDTSGCIISAAQDYLIATIGVKDLVIIQDGDCTLVARKEDEGRVKEIVDRLKAGGKPEYL